MSDCQKLRRSEWSPGFEKKMRNRLILGAYRYGLLNDPEKPKFDRVEDAIKRIELYKKTGNMEYLVDVANLMLLEYEESEHPNQHFGSVDDGHHTARKH